MLSTFFSAAHAKYKLMRTCPEPTSNAVDWCGKYAQRLLVHVLSVISASVIPKAPHINLLFLLLIVNKIFYKGLSEGSATLRKICQNIGFFWHVSSLTRIFADPFFPSYNFVLIRKIRFRENLCSGIFYTVPANVVVLVQRVKSVVKDIAPAVFCTRTKMCENHHRNSV